MYFTKIRLNGLEIVDLPIVDAQPTDIYILKAADGLGPPEVDVSIANTLNAGGFYQGRRPQPREVVVRVGLNPNYAVNQSVSNLRETLYGLLTPGSSDSVRIEIMDKTTLLVYTTGYVKKFEIVPFSQVPEAQITFSCLEQYLLAPADLYLEPVDKVSPFIDNMGTGPSGFHMEVTFNASVPSWTLTNDVDNKMQINQAFSAGDTLIIDTRPGYRGIWLKQGSTTTNIIHTLSSDSKWFMLHGGMNIFTTSAQTFDWGDVFYRPQYWGI